MATGWFFLTALVLIGIVCWAIFNVYNAQEQREEVIENKVDLEESALDEQKDLQAILKNMDTAVSSYLAADNIEDKLAYVRHPERIRPLMEKFYQTEKFQPSKFIRFNNLGSVALNSRPFIMAEVITSEGKENMMVEQVEGGSFLIDWETDVYFVPMEWGDFIKNKPKESVEFRIRLTKDDFYAYEFRNEAEYQCYRLTDRAGEKFLFAYAKKGSNTMRKIERVYHRTVNKPISMILKLRFPEGGNSKQCVIIEECTSERWMYVNPPNHEKTEE